MIGAGRPVVGAAPGRRCAGGSGGRQLQGVGGLDYGDACAVGDLLRNGPDLLGFVAAGQPEAGEVCEGQGALLQHGNGHRVRRGALAGIQAFAALRFGAVLRCHLGGFPPHSLKGRAGFVCEADAWRRCCAGLGGLGAGGLAEQRCEVGGAEIGKGARFNLHRANGSVVAVTGGGSGGGGLGGAGHVLILSV